MKAFRDAISRLLECAKDEKDNCRGNALKDQRVLELLRYWMIHDVSLEESRKKWILDPLSDNWIASFKKEEDRNALCHFFLTGELCFFTNLFVFLILYVFSRSIIGC